MQCRQIEKRKLINCKVLSYKYLPSKAILIKRYSQHFFYMTSTYFGKWLKKVGTGGDKNNFQCGPLHADIVDSI
jgi:hypothetical protein